MKIFVIVGILWDRERRKNSIGNLNDCRTLIIPIINEIFDEFIEIKFFSIGLLLVYEEIAEYTELSVAEVEQIAGFQTLQ